MKNVRKLLFIFSIFASFFLLFGYPFFRISYALYFEPGSGPPDIISMLPLSYWVLTAIILSLLVFQILLARSNFEIKLQKLFLTVFVPVILYASLPISQFPSIFTVNDAVLHLADAENVILNAGIHTPASGYLQFPGAALLVSMIGNIIGITGGDPLLQLGIILNALFAVLISLFLLVIGQRLLGSRNGFVLPVLYFLLNTGFFTQFCSQNFALVLYFMAIFVFLSLGEKSIQSKYATIILVFISSVITIIHPITCVFMIATFFGVYLGQKIFKMKIGVNISVSFLLTIGGLLIAWWVFFATENFEALMNSFFSLIQTGFHFAPTAAIVQTFPTFPAQVLSSFTKTFQISNAVAAIVGLFFVWIERKTKTAPVALLAFVIGLLIVSIFPLVLLKGDFADRPLQFAYFPISALAILGLEHISSISTKKIRFARYWRTVGLCLLIIIIPFAFIYHHQNSSIVNANSSDFSTTAFLLKFSPSTAVAFPWNIGMSAEYYFQDPAVMNIHIDHSPSTILGPYVFVAWFNNPQVLVFSIKETRYAEYTGTTSNDAIELSYLNKTFDWDRVYDNGFNNAYASSSLANVSKTGQVP